MSKSKLFVSVAALAVLAMLLVSCAPSAVPTPEVITEVEEVEVTRVVEGEAETIVVTATPPPPEEVTVQIFSNAWFPSSIAGRMALVDKFNEEYKGRIQVDWIQGSWDQAETYVQGGVGAQGGIACIVEWWTGGALEWYRKHWILDLRPYMDQEDWDLAIDEQWEARTYPDDGAIVMNGTVSEYPIMLVLYNPDHLAAAGVEPATIEDPWTWEELIENAKLMTLDADGNHFGEAGFDADNVTQWGFLLRLDPEKVWSYGLAAAQNRMGKPVIREENGEWGWYLDEEGQEVYADLLSIIEEGVTPDIAIGLSGDSLMQALVDGTASMAFREAFAIPILHDNYPDFEFAAMPVPSVKGEAMHYEGGTEGMVLTRYCEHPAEAAEFMFWSMKAENLAPYAHGNGMLPVNYEALEYEPFASDPTWDIIKDYIARGKIFTSPFNPYIVEFRDTVAAPLLMEVAAGERTFAEANAILEEQAKLMLNQPVDD
jgi:multiple sugar transport system substrate-binding protein